MQRKNLRSILSMGMAAAMLLSVTACGGAGTQETPAPDTAVQEETKPKAEETRKPEQTPPAEDAAKEEAPAEKDYAALYAPILDEVKDVLANGYDYEKKYAYIADGLMEDVMYTDQRVMAEDVGCLLEDLNGDSIPELLVGRNRPMDYSEGPEVAVVYSCFGLKDDKPFQVFSSMTRSCHYWMGDGHFYFIGSNGAMSTLFGECHLNAEGTELAWDDFYFSDGKDDGSVAYYHNKTGVFDAAEADLLSISDSAFAKLMDGYTCDILPWIRISDPAEAGGVGVTYEQNTVTIDGTTYDLREIVPVSNAVMGYREAGSWIIVESHINPQRSVYAFYNVYSKSFEYDLLGTNLVWWEDDPATGVLFDGNTLCDIFGNMFAWAEGDEEFCGLSMKDDHTILVECRPASDPNGRTYTREFEHYTYDHAMFDYYTALVSETDSDWAAFYNQAPANALAFVMQDPPARFLENDKFYNAANLQGGISGTAEYTPATIVAVSLANGEKIRIESYESDPQGPVSYRSRSYRVNRGDPIPFGLTTIPEGMPMDTLVITDAQGLEMYFPITMISGEHVQMCEFLCK